MIALTLFAGAGGADLGIRDAGLSHAACVEVDADCIATLTAAGFPAVRAGVGGPYEVRKGKAGRLVETVPAFDPSPYVGADLVWASPPCQPYSRAGKGLGAEDSRDGWPGTLAVLAVVRPTWAIIENVSGAPVKVWSAELAGLGCVVSAWTLDAADYGVPQNRVREFIVAGPRSVRASRPTHHGPRVPMFARVGMRPWVSMGEALPHLRGSFVRAEQLAATSRAVTEPCPTLSVCGNHYVHATDVGARGKHPDNDPSRPAGTIRSDAAFLATGRRRLTWRESAILQGFPADWPFAGNVTSKYRQCGNAVVPHVAFVVVSAILSN